MKAHCYELAWQGKSVVVQFTYLSDDINQVATLLSLTHKKVDDNLTDVVIYIDKTDSGYHLRFSLFQKQFWFDNRDDLIVHIVTFIGVAFLNSCQQLVLHSGAIAVDGQAILFTGLPFAGKSSLALSAWLHGYPLISDDWLVFNERGQSVSPFPKPLKPRITTSAIPEPIQQQVTDAHLQMGLLANELRLIIGKESPNMVPYSAQIPVNALFYIERASHTAIKPLEKQDALRLILEQVMPTKPSCLKIATLIQSLAMTNRLYHLAIGENKQEQAFRTMINTVAS